MDIYKTKTFKIGELFEKIKVSSLNLKVSDAKKIPDEKYNLPALTAGIDNQGLSCYVPRENATILKNVISVSSNGANAGSVFYQSNEFTVLQDAYAIEYRDKSISLSDNIYLYFLTLIRKSLHGQFNWTNKAIWDRVRILEIDVPVKKDDSIDYEYMEQYISTQKKIIVDDLIKHLKNLY